MKNLLRAVPLAFLLGAFLGALEGICLLFFVDLQFRQPALEMFGMEWRHGLLGVVALPVALLVAIVLRLPRKTPADLAGWSFLGISWLILNMWIHTEVYRHASVFRGQPLLILLGSIAAVFILHWVFRRVTAKTTKHAIIVICAGVIFLPVKAQFGYTRATPPPTAQVSADLPDITVVVIDTLRADHLGLYGYSRKDGEQTSPFMDSFAAESLVFENCWSQAPWTRPSMASLHSGLFCSSHGVNATYHTLPDEITSMAEMAHAQGYRTGGFSANANVSYTYGFDQGFEELWNVGLPRTLVSFAQWGVFKHQIINKIGQGFIWDGSDHAEIVNDKTYRWLDSVADDPRPKFTYVHYIDPHTPYEPPEGGFLFEGERDDLDVLKPYLGRRGKTLEYPFGSYPDPGQEIIDKVVRAYDSEIRYVDSQLEKLLDDLKSRGQLDDNDWLFITSDHGEEFYGRGHWGHGQSLFEEQIHVPLIVSGPIANKGARQKQEVNLLDVHTTIADITGFSPRPTSPGISLLPLMDGELHLDEANTRILYSERLQPPKFLYAVRQNNSKLMQIPDWEFIAQNPESTKSIQMWFDLNSNPAEASDFDFRTMIGDEATIPRNLPALQAHQELSALMDYARGSNVALKGAVESAFANMSAADRKHLQELGYLDKDGNMVLGGN